MSVVNRLTVYGTLAPGKPSNHQLEGLKGSWQREVVRGILDEDGWGATMGYPALVLEPEEGLIEVQIFESEDLAS